jgi:hypothetical protein
MSVKKAPRIPLPKAWTKHVRSAMLHVISLAQFARCTPRVVTILRRTQRAVTVHFASP